MTDAPITDTDHVRALRVVASALRDVLDAERARSDRYRDALVRIGTVGARSPEDAIDIACEALGKEPTK